MLLYEFLTVFQMIKIRLRIAIGTDMSHVSLFVS